MNGPGVIFVEDGDIYEGEFKSGLMNGFGIHYRSHENTSIFGTFKDGEHERELSRMKGRPCEK
jgi:hypothetical protein